MSTYKPRLAFELSCCAVCRPCCRGNPDVVGSFRRAASRRARSAPEQRKREKGAGPERRADRSGGLEGIRRRFARRINKWNIKRICFFAIDGGGFAVLERHWRNRIYRTERGALWIFSSCRCFPRTNNFKFKSRKKKGDVYSFTWYFKINVVNQPDAVSCFASAVHPIKKFTNYCARRPRIIIVLRRGGAGASVVLGVAAGVGGGPRDAGAPSPFGVWRRRYRGRITVAGAPPPIVRRRRRRRRLRWG